MNREDIIRMALEAVLQRRAVRKVDDIIRMAREAGFICLFPDEAVNGIGTVYDTGDEEITEMMERFAALVAAHEREKIAAWMMQRGFATGHGETVEEMLAHLEWQVAEAEREACARICDEERKFWKRHEGRRDGAASCATAIRARGEEPKRHPGYIIGDHWLQAAYTRICTGETEDEVMTDYGWQRARGEK